MLFVLSLVKALKQQFNELINEKCQTNRDQKLNLLFLQRHNWYWGIWFKLTKDRHKIVQWHLDALHFKKIGDYENIYNPLHLIIGKVDGPIEEKNKIKYLVFDFRDENKEVLK